MKHKSVTRSSRTMRSWYKALATVVAVFGMVFMAQSQSTVVGKYPFPQNYSYPYGVTFMGSGTTEQIQLLYSSWKSSYYEEKTVNSVNMARIKFVQADEPAGANTVSEGIAYGMLVTLWMDNTTNKTKNMFDRLYAYYKFNKDAVSGVLMNWKVVGFTGTVTAPASGNSNSATDADLDVAASLILAAEQWPGDQDKDKIYYQTEAQKMLNAIWGSEVMTTDYHLKPGDAFDDWLNPCYFITNELELFAKFDTGHDWGKVRDKSYAIMKKAADPTTGLIPDWVNNNSTYSYITPSASNPKFTSYFLYDAIRIPWRLAMAYSWYGHADAKSMASKIVDWASTKYSNSPGSIVDGYFLDGTPFDGAKVGLGSAYPTQGKNHNPCFSGGIGVGGMVDSKYSTWLSNVWNTASAVDAYGMYYTNTCQLMYMMYMTGNMPNLTDMQPVFVSAGTSTDGTTISILFSKELLSTSVPASAASFVVKDGKGTHEVASAKLSADKKTVVLTLKSAVIKAPMTVQYTGTTLQSNDATPKAVASFGPFEVTNNVTDGIPTPLSSRTNQLGSKVFVVMDKEMDGGTIVASEFSITVNGTAVTIASASQNADNVNQIDLVIDNTPVASKNDVIKVTYNGANLSSASYVPADPFTMAVTNLYATASCVLIDDVSGNAGWQTYGKGVLERVADPTGGSNNTLHYNTGGGDNDLKTTLLSSKKLRDAFNNGYTFLNYRIYPKTAISKLRFRLFDVTNALNWGDNQVMDESTAIDATELNKWTTKTLDLSSLSGGTFPLDGMSINITPDVADAGEFYMDDINLCSAVPIPHLISAYVSWDGKTIIAKYNVPVAAPQTISGLSGTVKTTFNTNPLKVTAITSKAGDGSELIFTLETPISDKTATITLTYDKAGSIKDPEGVATESASIIVLNNYNKYVTSGWYDDFNDATDFITANVGGDYAKTEKTTEVTGQVAGLLNIDGKAVTGKYKSMVVAVTDQVWDLSQNPYVTFRYRYTGTTAAYLKVQLKDVAGKTADEMSTMTLKSGTDWNEVTVDFHGHFIERYQDAIAGSDPVVYNVHPVDPTGIVNAQFMLYSDKSTGAAFTGTIDFDRITIGKPIRVYNVATTANQGATVAATANFDGSLYLVPANTPYTIDAFKAAVFAKTATTITCKTDVAAAIPTTGLSAGTYWVVGYYPSTGGLTAKAYVSIKDITAPKITSTVISSYNYGSVLPITTDEKAQIYLVKAGTPATYDAIIAGDQRFDTTVVSNTSGVMNLIGSKQVDGSGDSIYTYLGQKFMLYAVDDSKNISLPSSTFTIVDGSVPTFGLPKTTFAQPTATTSNAQIANNVIDVSAVTLYIVPISANITTKADLVANSVATSAELASVAPSKYATSYVTPIRSLAITNAQLKAVPVGYYYVYVADKWGNISARSPMIQVVASVKATQSVSLPTSLTVQQATTVSATDPNASAPQTVTFNPTDANDQISYTWESENTDYVVVFPGTDPKTAVIVGKKATTTPINVKVTVMAGLTIATASAKIATMAVTVEAGSVTKPVTGITITKGGTSVSKTTVDVAMGTTATFAATIAPADATEKGYSFVSTDPLVATVDAATGVVTPAKVGTTKVVVVAKGNTAIKDTVTINVPAIAVASVTIGTPTATTIKVGENLSLTATVLPANATYQDVNWTVSNANGTLGTAVVTDNTSKITLTGAAVGKVTVTATSVKYPTISSSVDITVESKIVEVVSIASTTTALNLKVNEVATAAPTITFNPTNATVQTLTWSIESTVANFATVSGSGIVTAGATAGTGYLVATSTSNTAAVVKIPLTIAAYEPTSVVLTPTTGLTVKVGEVKSVFTKVSVEPAQASQAVSYSIDKPTVATIDATTGKVIGVAVGTATITVKSSKTGVEATATIEVLPVLVSTITLNKSTLSLIKGNKFQLLATTVSPDNATNKAIKWTSSASSIVSVNETTGQITAAGVGSATITATAADGGGAKATCDVTVSAVAVTAITLSSKSLTIATNDPAKTVTATIVPDSAAVQTVTYTVDPATGIITVSQTGNTLSITPSAEGDAVITVSAGGVSEVCSVKVVATVKPVESVTVAPTTKDVFVGDADFSLKATVLPAEADQTVAWTSSDSKVVTVKDGLVSIVGAGTATVTAAGGNSKSGTCVVTVSKRLVTKLTVDPTSISFNTLGAEKTISVVVAPDNASDKTYSFESSDPTVATVDANGKVIAKKFSATPVTITIKSTDGGATETVSVSVTQATVSTIAASSTAAISVDAGSKATLPVITVTMSDASTNSNATWSSADETVAKFVNGELVAVAPGTTTITAKADADPTKTVEITVTVNKVDVISISGVSSSETLTVNASKDFTVSILPLNATNKTVTALSANTAAVTASVSGNTVTIKGIAVTTSPVAVTVTVDGKSAVCSVTVSDVVIPVQSVTFDEPSVSIQRDVTTKKLAITINPGDATVTSKKFSSADESIVTVSADGTLTPVKAGGPVEITVTVDGKTAKIPVTILPIPVSSINTGTTTSITLAPGTTTELKTILKVVPENADNQTASYAVTSGTSATVNATSGLVTASSTEGTSVVTITVGGKTTTVEIVVKSGVIPVESVTTTDVLTQSVEVGKSITLTASVAPETASVKTITWSSTDPDVYVTLSSTVNGTCTVTGKNAGQVTVYATANNGKKISYTVNVTAKVSSITVTGDTELEVNASGTLTASIQPAGASQDVTYSIVSGSGISLTQNGIKATVTATGAIGDQIVVKVKANDGSNIESAQITVKIIEKAVPPTSLTVTSSETQLQVGATATLTVGYTPSNTTQKAVTYTSSNTSVATVAEDGTITAVHGGTATITVTSSVNTSVKKTITITVIEKVSTITVTGVKPVSVGNKISLTVTVAPATASDKTFTVTSANPAIATAAVVSGKIEVTGKAVGTTKLTVTSKDGGATAEVTIEVISVPVTAILMDVTSAEIAVGSTVAIKASVSPTTATNKDLTYTSSAPAIATVDANGVVTGVSEGDDVIISVKSVSNPSVVVEFRVTVSDVIPNIEALRAIYNKGLALSDSVDNKKITAKAEYVAALQSLLSQTGEIISDVETENTPYPSQNRIDDQVKLLDWAIKQVRTNSTVEKPVLLDADAVAEVEVTVGPNPTVDVITVRGSSIKSVVITTISASVDKVSGNGNDEVEINTSTWATGTYTLLITTKTGVKEFKVVKQ